ncbi:hypothetical protein, partial [Salipiger sp. PrR002]
MTPRDIHDPGTGLKALRNNPRLHIDGPTPVPAAWLDNLAPPNILIPDIRHEKSPSLSTDLLAETSHGKNVPNQWGGNGAY